MTVAAISIINRLLLFLARFPCLVYIAGESHPINNAFEPGRFEDDCGPKV